MLTRCPGCATAFRVHPEQLKVRQGKVRCGQCQRVFNALDSLIEELVTLSPDLLPDAVLSAPTSTTSSAGAAGAHVGEVPPEDAPELIDIGEALPPPGADIGKVQLAVAFPARATEPPESELPPAELLEPDLHEGEPGGGSSLVWLWASGIIVAIVALLLQGLLHFRVELATLLPESRPHLLAACDVLGCRLELPRKVELLTIEGSDLHPDAAFSGQPGRLGLKVTLLNRAPFAQAWPALELTLTDTADRPLIRRVLSAQEYLIDRAPTQDLLDQGIAPRQDVSFELALDTGDLVASGYRLYLFFP